MSEDTPKLTYSEIIELVNEYVGDVETRIAALKSFCVGIVAENALLTGEIEFLKRELENQL